VKVLILADSLGNGGQERQMSLLAASLPAECQRHLWTMGGGPFEVYLRERSIDLTIEERLFRFDPLPAASLSRFVHRWRPDVVHSWSWMSALAAAPVCAALRIPLVNGMIRSGEVDLDFVRFKRLGLAAATLVVANTRAGLRAWGVSQAKGRVVYNGFDEARLAGLAEREGAEDGRFTVVMTGRMTPVKHYDLVIEVARRLSLGRDDCRFVLVGDGPDRGRLQHAAHDLLARGVVVFPEPGSEVLPLVRDADVGVLMTNPRLAREGLSNSIMEYMALGLPVVCGDGGGNPELVAHETTGFIVPQDDPAALAERLAYLRDHPDARAAMGAAGKAKVLTDLSVPAMVRAMLGVYAEAVTLTRARRAWPCRPTSRG
jgi:glycosyltransferase involved in cell wall biosynthesis